MAAITARETPACAARVDTAPTASPPAELLLGDVLGLSVAAGEPDEVADELVRVVNVVLTPVLEVDDAVVEVVTDVPLPDVEETGLVLLLLLPPRYDGAGTAEDGLASAPVPQGIGCPLGWFAFDGGTVAPVESAMANRPVHVRLVGAAGELNW